MSYIPQEKRPALSWAIEMKKARTFLGAGIVDAAHLMRICPSVLINVETGEAGNPNGDLLERLRAFVNFASTIRLADDAKKNEPPS